MNIIRMSSFLLSFVLVMILMFSAMPFLYDFAITNSALAQNTTNNIATPNTIPAKQIKTANKFLTYTNPSFGIEIQFPSNWVVSRNGLRDYSEIVGFYAP